MITKMPSDGPVANRQQRERIANLYVEASGLPVEQQRAFLDQVCSGDSSMRAELERMLGTDSGSPEQAGRPPAERRLPPGRDVAGRFRIRRFIAHGGMGDVYEAEDLELRERVALKTVRAEVVEDPQALSRFKREILVGKKITHPNVCRVHDLGIDRTPGGSTMLFLTMEFLDGETLSSRIRRGPIPQNEAVPLIEEMAGALSAAHQAGIVHRDFKSGNVMLVGAEGRARAIITDFGLARAMRTSDSTVSMTESGTTMGTPAYMAPEQVRGEAATPASDIYALGVVMYEMLTGRCPFVGETPLVVGTKQLHEEPAPPRTLAPHLDPKWDQVILRCLRKAPGERFSSAPAVVAALAGPALDGPAAAPVPPRSAARPSPRRRPIVLLSAASLLAVGAAGWWWIHSSHPPLADGRGSVSEPLPAGSGANRPLAPGSVSVPPPKETAEPATLPNAGAPAVKPAEPVAKKAAAGMASGPTPKLPPPRAVLQPYGGPLRGVLRWSGRLAPHESVTIQAGRVLTGALTDDLPRAPVTVEVDTKWVVVVEEPSERNHWDRLVLRNNSDNETVQGIVVRWSVIR
ncbi:MAG: protein kinase [Acidobacteriia bacterium]|nr:protein kinase [Terriglobia bacterium]